MVSANRPRIRIARALYRDPSVPSIDEATSVLDGETEAAANESIRGLSGQKTTAVIARRQASLLAGQAVIDIQR